MKIIQASTPEEWHAIRTHYVGGSEIAALFGLSPYMTKFQLWHVKAGNIPAEDLSEVERVMAGNYMEPAIAAWASDKWGVPLGKFQGYAAHDEIEGLGCTPDYMNTEKTLNVQIKNVDSLQFTREWTADGDEVLEAPIHILLQVQHELAVTGASLAWLVVCVGGNRLLRMVIEPRPVTAQKISKAVSDFWQSIADKIEPKPVFSQDGETIAALHLEGVKGKEIDLSTNNRAHEVCSEYLRGQGIEKEGKVVKDAAKAELITMMGDASKGFVGEFTISTATIKENKGKRITPDMIGMIVGAKKGYRRITVTNKGEEA